MDFRREELEAAPSFAELVDEEVDCNCILIFLVVCF
jgi:hypothetical protein